MSIQNNRNLKDYACLDSLIWSDILIGTDGYPTEGEDGWYLIAGGDKEEDFKATAIEFYGVKTQT